MPVNSIKTFQTLHTANCVCVTGSADMDDAPAAGGAVLLLTAGAEGGMLTKLTALPRATVADTQLALFSSLDAGVTQRLFDLQKMLQYVFATSTYTPKTDFGYSLDNPLWLMPAEKIYCAIGISLAAGIVFRASWLETV